jgi:hypothetical protein
VGGQRTIEFWVLGEVCWARTSASIFDLSSSRRSVEPFIRGSVSVKAAFAKWPLLIPARAQRARFFDDARGSALECAACLDASVPDSEHVHEEFFIISSRRPLRVYWWLGLAVGDGVTAGCGAKLLLMSMTLSG